MPDIELIEERIQQEAELSALMNEETLDPVFLPPVVIGQYSNEPYVHWPEDPFINF